MSSKKYLPGPESYREFRETAPASFLTKSCFIFEFCVICSELWVPAVCFRVHCSCFGCFVFKFFCASFSSSFFLFWMLRFRAHFCCVGCFVFGFTLPVFVLRLEFGSLHFVFELWMNRTRKQSTKANMQIELKLVMTCY